MSARKKKKNTRCERPQGREVPVVQKRTSQKFCENNTATRPHAPYTTPAKKTTNNKQNKKSGTNRSTRRVPKKNATSAQPLGGKSTPLATKPRPHERLRFHLSPSASRLPACLPMWLLWVSHRTTAHKQSRDETHFGPAREANEQTTLRVNLNLTHSVYPSDTADIHPRAVYPDCLPLRSLERTISHTEDGDKSSATLRNFHPPTHPPTILC